MSVRITFPFEPTPAQYPALTNSAEYKLLGGARGGGKSASIGGILATVASTNPGINYVLMRADLQDLKKSTLLELFKFLPKDRYRYNINGGYVEVQTIVPGYPSTIWLAEGKDPNSIKSSNIGGVFADEADEIPRLTWTNATASVRASYPEELWGKTNPIAGQPFGQFPAYYKVAGSNPAPCWLEDIFPVQDIEQRAYREAFEQDPYFAPFASPYRDYDGKQIDADYLYVPLLAKDNPYNPPGYFEQLIADYGHDPVLLARNVYGRWDVSMEGLVYSLLKEHRWSNDDPDNPTKRLLIPNHPVVLGIDPSNGSGTYACVVLQFVNGRVYQVDEWGQEGGMDEDLADWLHGQPFANQITDAVADHAKPDSVKRLRALGIPARPCRAKEVVSQINSVKALLKVDPGTGKAAYLMDEARCPRTRREFGKRSYRKVTQEDRQDGKRSPEQPVKAWDHFLNALEYVVHDKLPVASKGMGARYRQPERQAGRFRGRPNAATETREGTPYQYSNGYRAPARAGR